MIISLRKTEYIDMEMLFLWANDETTRRNSFHTERIEFSGHQSWFEKNMSDTNIHMLILQADTIPIGQIRLSIESDTAVISYSIAKEYRGHGYGTALIPLIEKYTQDACPGVYTIIAYVKEDNAASRKLMESNGYECEKKSIPYQCLEYRKILKS